MHKINYCKRKFEKKDKTRTRGVNRKKERG